MLGKLDGITQLLPDLDFFIFMYILKEATRSTIVDIIKTEAKIENKYPQDFDRIMHYISAMEYGLKRLKTLPLSLRFITEIHKQMLSGTIDALGKTLLESSERHKIGFKAGRQIRQNLYLLQ